MLTPFGKQLRKHRIDRSAKLKDLADFLKVTSSYLSALEMGRKNVPSSLLTRVSEYLKLSEHDSNELKHLAEKSKKINTVDTSELNRKTSHMVGAFARHFDELETHEKEKIKEILNRFNKEVG